jgi:hypothetical protein
VYFRIFFLIIFLSTGNALAGDDPTGKWQIYERGDAQEFYAALDAQNSEDFFFGPPRLVLYCVPTRKSFGLFIHWNQFIDDTIHPIELKVEQSSTLVMSWLAGQAGEDSWLPAGHLTIKRDCQDNNCDGVSRVSMTRLDLIGELIEGTSLSISTQDSQNNKLSAVFNQQGMRAAAKQTLGFCGIEADAL